MNGLLVTSLLVRSPVRQLPKHRVREVTKGFFFGRDMNDLQKFTFSSDIVTCPVRVTTIDDEPWFVAADVLSILDLDRKALERLDDDERGVSLVHTPGGMQNATVVSEPGLYSLILGSRKPSAKAFKRWVTHELLPTLRKTGRYEFSIPKTLSEALRLAADQAETIEQQAAVIEHQRPAVEFHEAVQSTNDAVSVRDLAKVLGTGQNRLYGWLRENRILMADNRPYQPHLDNGNFRVIETVWKDSAGQPHVAFKTLVTGKGQAYIAKRLNEVQEDA